MRQPFHSMPFAPLPGGYNVETSREAKRILRAENFSATESFEQAGTSSQMKGPVLRLMMSSGAHEISGSPPKSQEHGMKAVVVRYKTKPESTEENERLIKSVFRELEAKAPDGIRYVVVRLGDGSFVHFAMVETSDGVNPLRGLEAFRSFTANAQDRCIDPPLSADATIVGNYRGFG